MVHGSGVLFHHALVLYESKKLCFSPVCGLPFKTTAIWGDTEFVDQVGLVVHIYNPGTWVQAGGLGFQGHPWIHGDCETSWGYIKSHLKTKQITGALRADPTCEVLVRILLPTVRSLAPCQSLGVAKCICNFMTGEAETGGSPELVNLWPRQGP